MLAYLFLITIIFWSWKCGSTSLYRDVYSTACLALGWNFVLS